MSKEKSILDELEIVDIETEDLNNEDELDEILNNDEIKVPKELEEKIINLLGVNKYAIQEIVEVEPKIYVVTIENEDESFTNYSYSEVEDNIYEIPDSLKTPKKQFLTEEEKTQYYLDNKRLITFALKKISRPDGIDFGELEDVGTFGFVKALNTFDKANGTRFSTYAVKCVLNEVYYFLRKEQKHLMMTDSLDKEVATDNNGNSLTVGDTISNSISNNEKSTEDKMLLEELRKTLLDCIATLPDDEQYLIIYRYGLDNNIIKTQTEIAETLNMSQANISKLEKTCLKKLRTILKRNNYVYDAKDKRLECSGLPLNDLLKMDDSENYLDRDCRENIELGVCQLLNMDIQDIVDVKPTKADHTYLVTFNANDRVGVLYNNIINRYEFTALPLSNKDKFLYLINGISLKSNFTKEDLLDTKYQVDMSDKDFSKLIKTLDKNKQYIVTHKYGLFDKNIKTCANIGKDLNLSSNEVYKLDRETLKELSATLKNKKRK